MAPVLFDLCSLYWLYLQTIARQLLFLLNSLMSIKYIAKCGCRHLRDVLCGLTIEISKRHRRLYQREFVRKLQYYRNNHWFVLHTILKVNREFTSKFFVIAFVTNLPIAVSFQAMLLLQKNLTTGQTLIMASFEIIQILVTIGAVTNMCTTIDDIYSSPRYLVKIQQFIYWQFLRDKLKLMCYYEQMHNRKRFGFTVGIFGRISKKSVTKVCRLRMGRVDLIVVCTETVTMPLSRDVLPLEMNGNNIFEGTIVTVSVQTINTIFIIYS